MLINPFNELYLAENLPSERYVQFFSPYLVTRELALPLFLPGNVVIQGVQGSGKSMLLNLLSPEVRIAYLKAQVEFPVPLARRNFISAGINLARSGIRDFAQRPIVSNEVGKNDAASFFADYMNYWIVAD